MTATDAQVRLLMKERSKGKTQEQAAVKANIGSRKTVRKYEQLDKLPSELKRARGYRTRTDPFGADWSEVEKKLEEAPELEAKTIKVAANGTGQNIRKDNCAPCNDISVTGAC
jgi:transcriptional regulator with XRE-family HTH domain